MKPETYRPFNERRRTFEAYEPLALALSILAHQLDEDIVESGGGGHGGSGHGHTVVNHFFFFAPWKAGGSCRSHVKNNKKAGILA